MTTSHSLHDATCRVAVAAYLHDLGKFAERAGVFDADPRLQAHLTLYCPFRQQGGYHTHRHAAHTALGFDVLEPYMPGLAAGDIAPFTGLGRRDDGSAKTPSQETDSLINASAAHHKPDSFLQWVVATADRIASGFEREEFERYNESKDETRLGLDHYTARQLTLFEQIRLDGPELEEKGLQWRYPLRPLSPASIFPQPANKCEGRDRDAARTEYARLWQWFLDGLKAIPASHRSQWPLWLDHFDSLWMSATHAIPSATAFGVKPDVSLFDHSRTTAALAAALWRWHHETGLEGTAAAAAMRDRTDFDKPKFVLVQGDFFGIQDFIFADGGQTRRGAVRLLRGRSFQVSLFTELAALRILDALGLPSTSQVINAAGKFLIVAPNTPATLDALEAVRGELDAWFLEHTFGQAGIGLAWEEACCQDFISGVSRQGASRFAQLRERLVISLDRIKHRRFDLCARGAYAFTQVRFPHGACAYNGRLPADEPARREQPASCALSRDQLAIGRSIVQRFERLLILRPDDAVDLRESASMQPLEQSILGYRVAFTVAEEASGRFGGWAASGAMRRCLDFSAPRGSDRDGSQALWSGYARRFISGHVPRASGQERQQADRYVGVPDDEYPRAGDLVSFDLLASGDREPAADGEGYRGVAALGVLKGDIDNLGELFRAGLQRPSFAKHAALSRQVNAFFAIYAPWLLEREYPSVYTVFAGGDDFFLIGPWRTVQRAARRLREEFGRYVAGNPTLHFSAGIATVKSGAPIQTLARLAEDALSASKAWHTPAQAGKPPSSKNAVTCCGQTVPWDRWPELESAASRLEQLHTEVALSTAYVYGLLQFIQMREREQAGDVTASIWRSRFGYRTRRFVVDRLRGLDEAGRKRRYTELADDIGQRGIRQLGPAYRVAIFNHLYRFRDR
jgi:CRISPR-associated protein Csm1